LVLLLVWCPALWLLAGRQPSPWPDAAAPWFSEVQALEPLSRALDRLDAWLPLTPDLAAGSVLVLALLGATTLAATLALDVPPLIALAVAWSLLATRSAWSTVTPGHDAVPMLLVSVGVLAVTVPRVRRVALASVLVGLALAAPMAGWLVAPALAGVRGTWRRRSGAALLAFGIAATATVWLLRQAWLAVPCLNTSDWMTRLAEVVRPGVSADLSPLLALRQLMAVLAGDVHAFGLLIAVAGLVAATGPVRALRTAVLTAVGVALVTVSVGVLPPAHAAALLLPWWAPCVGLGLTAFVRAVRQTRQSAARAFAMSVVVAIPLLRHVVVLEQPWTTTMPAITEAVAPTWAGNLVVSADAALTRRLRRLGVATLPGDADVVHACLASGRRVHALGPGIQHLENLGFRLDDVALRVPMAAVLRDVQPGQLVALAFTPGALAWAGAQGLSALARVGVHAHAVPATYALAVVARADADDGRVQASRDGTDVTLAASSRVGRRPVLFPLTVHADRSEASVGTGLRRLATSAQAALVVLDRTEAAALRAGASASAGLPISLGTHAQWRHALVSGVPSCVEATRAWTVIEAPAEHISVPVQAASPSRPVVLYLATAERPQIDVSGLASQASGLEWVSEVFDRSSDGAARLRARIDDDGAEAEALGDSRFAVRVELRPRDTWRASRVVLSAGATPARWLVRLTTRGHMAESSRICRVSVRGRPILRGQSVVDDDSGHEVGLWARDGWHAAEEVQGVLHQWTSRASATARFDVDVPRGLVLALDVGSVDTPTGQQPVTVRVNGVIVHSTWRGAGRLDIPASLLHPGENELALEVARVVQPAHDTRHLGVLVRQVRLIAPPTP
jgi:hypothetical protein